MHKMAETGARRLKDGTAKRARLGLGIPEVPEKESRNWIESNAKSFAIGPPIPPIDGDFLRHREVWSLEGEAAEKWRVVAGYYVLSCGWC
jgi:hypothetical protein